MFLEKSCSDTVTIACRLAADGSPWIALNHRSCTSLPIDFYWRSSVIKWQQTARSFSHASMVRWWATPVQLDPGEAGAVEILYNTQSKGAETLYEGFDVFAYRLFYIETFSTKVQLYARQIPGIYQSHIQGRILVKVNSEKLKDKHVIEFHLKLSMLHQTVHTSSVEYLGGPHFPSICRNWMKLAYHMVLCDRMQATLTGPPSTCGGLQPVNDFHSGGVEEPKDDKRYTAGNFAGGLQAQNWSDMWSKEV